MFLLNKILFQEPTDITYINVLYVNKKKKSTRLKSDEYGGQFTGPEVTSSASSWMYDV